MNNYILDYYGKIKDGTIVVGRWVLLAYEMVVNGLEEKLFFYNPQKAKAAIIFVENFCHHHEGVLAPKKIKLELWQKAMLSLIFGIEDREGNRQFREIFIVVARKNGKTLLAAAIAEYMAYADGEYGGRIYFAAPKLEQASLAYDAFFNSVKAEPMLSELSKKRRTDIFIEGSNTTIKPLAFSAKKSDGLNISLGVCDEVASWAGDQGLKFYEVLKSSQGARKQPMLLSISTASYIDGGVYDELMMRSTRWLLGESKETRLLPLIYMIDQVEKWTDLNELKKSNPNLDVSVSRQFLQDEIAIAMGSLSKKAEFLTKYCNIKQKSSLAWLPAVAVQKSAMHPIKLEDFREHYCVAGIDLSQTTDLTSCCVVIEKNGILNIISKFFLPGEKLEEATIRDGLPYKQYIEKGWLQLSGDNVVDYEDCYRWFTDLIEKYRIYPLQTGYDRYCAQYLVKDLERYGFHCQDVYQGFNLTPVIREFEGLVRDGKVNIGDNDLLKIHLLNTALKQDSDSLRCRIVKLSAENHIDGCAAVLDAMTVRMHDYEEIGRQLKNEGIR